MSVYCYRCGQRLAGGARHCPGCGAEIFYDESGLREDFARRDPSDPPEMDEDAARAYSEHKEYEGTYGGTSCGGTAYNGDAYNGSSYNGTAYRPYGNAQRPASAPSSKRDGMALWGMLCGIGSLILSVFPFIGFALAVAAIVLGSLGLKSEQRRGTAIAGLVTGIIGLVLNAVMLVMVI